MVALSDLQPPLYQPRTTAQIKADFLASGLTAAEYLFSDTPELRAQRQAERRQRDLDLTLSEMRANGTNKRADTKDSGKS